MIIRNLYVSLFLLISCALGLSGCIGAAVGIGTAAVAASSTEKGLSTSVSDGIIEAKLIDRFIQNDASLATSIKKSVNNGSVLFTGSVRTIEQKVLATKLAWEIKGVREVVNELQITGDTSTRYSKRLSGISAASRGTNWRSKNLLFKFLNRCGERHCLPSRGRI